MIPFKRVRLAGKECGKFTHAYTVFVRYHDEDVVADSFDLEALPRTPKYMVRDAAEYILARDFEPEVVIDFIARIEP